MPRRWPCKLTPPTSRVRPTKSTDFSCRFQEPLRSSSRHDSGPTCMCFVTALPSYVALPIRPTRPIFRCGGAGLPMKCARPACACLRLLRSPTAITVNHFPPHGSSMFDSGLQASHPRTFVFKTSRCYVCLRKHKRPTSGSLTSRLPPRASSTRRRGLVNCSVLQVSSLARRLRDVAAL